MINSCVLDVSPCSPGGGPFPWEPHQASLLQEFWWHAWGTRVARRWPSVFSAQDGVFSCSEPEYVPSGTIWDHPLGTYPELQCLYCCLCLELFSRKVYQGIWSPAGAYSGLRELQMQNRPHSQPPKPVS